jgi:hypothetical protein
MLTELEYDILQKIVAYGGYVTKVILGNYKKGLTSCRYWQILKGLTDKGYLKQHNFFMDSTEPYVYQVTKKACSLFGRGDAYMRKKHQTALIIRYLIRAHFLFEIAGSGYSDILFSSVDRAAYFKERGFEDKVLPHKYNKGVGSIQIEEYILYASPYARENGFCVVYVDKNASTVSAQLANLLDRYILIIERGLCPVDFLILTETDSRAKEFETFYERRFEHGFRALAILKGYSINKTYQVRALCRV